MMKVEGGANSMFFKAGCAGLLMASLSAFTSYAFHGGHGRRAVANGGTSQQAGPGIRVNAILTSDGAQIRYLQAGQASSAPAIVFIPGWTLSASLWDHELRAFSADRLAIAVESRSQGGSAKMVTGNTPERRAIDLHEIVDKLQISKFVIVGWSQGAQDVAAYIQQFGTDSLAGVVFVDSPISAGPAEIDIHKEFSKVLLSRLSVYAEHPSEYSEGLVRSIFIKPHPELDMQHLVEESEKTPPSIGMAMLVMDIFGVDRRPALKKINRPTLVIASSASLLLEAQKEMAGEIPGARLVVVEDAGHALFIDQPEKFDDAVSQLLQTAGQ
jgi:non-heme chloroperoxidase